MASSRYFVHVLHSGTEDGPLNYVCEETDDGRYVPVTGRGWLNREDASTEARILNEKKES